MGRIISVRLEDEDLELIEKIRQSFGKVGVNLSRSEIIRGAIKVYAKYIDEIAVKERLAQVGQGKREDKG